MRTVGAGFLWSFDKFFKDTRQLIRGNSRTIVGHPQRYGICGDSCIDHHVRFGRRMHDRIPDDVPDRLARPKLRRLAPSAGPRQTDIDALVRAVASCRVHHALGDFSQVDPVPPQLERARIDAGDRQKIADHLVEVLGLPS